MQQMPTVKAAPKNINDFFDSRISLNDNSALSGLSLIYYAKLLRKEVNFIALILDPVLYS